MKNNTKFWFLEKFDLLEKVGRKDVMKLCEVLEMINIKKGDELFFNKGNKQMLFFLKTGTVKIVSNESNRTKCILRTGNIFGELPLFDNTPDYDKAVALEEGVICFIEEEYMKEMVKEYPSLKNSLLKSNGNKIRRLERRLEDLLYKDTNTRIKEYIFEYVKEFGNLKGDFMIADNLISHSDIASLTNTSRPTVSHLMSHLKKEGVIDYNSKEIRVANYLYL